MATLSTPKADRARATLRSAVSPHTPAATPAHARAAPLAAEPAWLVDAAPTAPSGPLVRCHGNQCALRPAHAALARARIGRRSARCAPPRCGSAPARRAHCCSSTRTVRCAFAPPSMRRGSATPPPLRRSRARWPSCARLRGRRARRRAARCSTPWPVRALVVLAMRLSLTHCRALRRIDGRRALRRDDGRLSLIHCRALRRNDGRLSLTHCRALRRNDDGYRSQTVVLCDAMTMTTDVVHNWRCNDNGQRPSARTCLRRAPLCSCSTPAKRVLALCAWRSTALCAACHALLLHWCAFALVLFRACG